MLSEEPSVGFVTYGVELLWGDSQYGEDFTHGFDTQNYPKLQASLGTEPENTHGIQRETQPIPVDFFG